MTDNDDDGSPDSGGPSPSDPYAPPPPGWRLPTAPVGMPPPPPPSWPPATGDGYRTPPAQWSPQPPPYAAPPGWQPPPPPAHAGYPPPAAPGTWQPTFGQGSAAGWPPAPEPVGPQLYGWPPPYPRNGGTSGFAIASFVLAVPPVCIFTFAVGSLLGVIFGIIALRQIRRDGSRGRGLAIGGIILGVLGLAVLGLVIVGSVVSNSGGSGGTRDNSNGTTISTMSHPPAASSVGSVVHRLT